MLALKINITKMIRQDEKDRIFKYSSLLSECYNLCLSQLKQDNDWTKIHPLSKEFQHNHKEIYSKHAQNIGREVINAVKSFFSKKKKDTTAKYPKNFRKYSVITLDSNRQKSITKDGSIHFNLGGGFKFIEDKIIKFTYPRLSLDLTKCNYFDAVKINKETIKQIVIKPQDDLHIWCIFIYAEEKKEKNLNNEFISIDPGISHIANIYSSIGECIKVKTKRFKGLEKSKNQIKSKRDKHKKGSNHWIKLHLKAKKKQRKISNKRDDYLHKCSKFIVNYCIKNSIDTIIYGDIQTKKLVTSKEEKKSLSFKERKAATTKNKSTQNEGLLSRFKKFISYKAANAAINVMLVNEAFTSQINCLTGKKELNSALSNREFELLPGFIVDRDLNSAVNIAKKCGALWSVHSFNKEHLLNVKEIDSKEFD